MPVDPISDSRFDRTRDAAELLQEGTTGENAFEQLCRLAASNNWCWKIPCTTCGNHHLRVGLVLIAHGIPLDAWDHDTTRWPDEIPPSFRGGAFRPDICQSARLGKVLGDADLAVIRRDAKDQWARHSHYHHREDWLGYLGVALARPRFRLGHRELAARSWRSQLDRMVGITEPNPLPVTFKELESYETLLLNNQGWF